jgi:hypothetical protein
LSQGDDPLTKVYKFLVQREAWMDEGRCFVEKADPALFVLDQGFTAQEARQRYCGRCEVREECLEYGKRTNSVGVWGGEVLAWGGREAVELTPIEIHDPLKDAVKMLNPEPAAQHQIPFVIFQGHGQQNAS